MWAGPQQPQRGRYGIRLPLVATAVVVVTAVLLDWATKAWADLRALPSTPSATPADAVADIAAVLGLAAWGWLLLGAVLTIAETARRRPGRRLAPRLAPAAWRRLVLATVGIGALSAPAAVAQAGPGEPPHAVASPGGPPHVIAVDTQGDPGRPPATSVAEAIRGLRLPDRPYGRLASIPPHATQHHDGLSRPVRRVVVRFGDSLWAIAEHRLGPQASTQAIATEWRRWYTANRALIGPDPDLISPGMVLHAPETKATS
jgi:nucleoid-associated protein YgaU